MTDRSEDDRSEAPKKYILDRCISCEGVEARPHDNFHLKEIKTVDIFTSIVTCQNPSR